MNNDTDGLVVTYFTHKPRAFVVGGTFREFLNRRDNLVSQGFLPHYAARTSQLRGVRLRSEDRIVRQYPLSCQLEQQINILEFERGCENNTWMEMVLFSGEVVPGWRSESEPQYWVLGRGRQVGVTIKACNSMPRHTKPKLFPILNWMVIA